MSKQGRKIDISKIQDFFDLILTERNASREEIDNFLHECLNFVFAINKIDISKYDINFHTLKQAQLKDFGAKMSQHQKYNNKFDVYFNDNSLVLKILNQNSISNIFIFCCENLFIFTYYKTQHIIFLFSIFIIVSVFIL